MYDISDPVIHWITDFLTSRKQRVKPWLSLRMGCGPGGGGGPQGTKLGSWLFINMINELDVPATDLWKYIDDTTTVWSRGVRAVQDVCY